MNEQIFCFKCGAMRSAEGHSTVDYGLGPRHFCAACKEYAVLAAEPLSASVLAVTQCAEQGKEVARPKREVVVKPKAVAGKVSLAAWVREQAKAGLDEQQIAKALVTEFPESKPGQKPSMAIGYVRCYLNRMEK